LGTGALADRAALFELAARAVSESESASIVRRPLVLLDVPLVTQAERLFVGRLIEHAPSVLVTVPPGAERTLAALAHLVRPAAPRSRAGSREPRRPLHVTRRPMPQLSVICAPTCLPTPRRASQHGQAKPSSFPLRAKGARASRSRGASSRKRAGARRSTGWRS